MKSLNNLRIDEKEKDILLNIFEKRKEAYNKTKRQSNKKLYWVLGAGLVCFCLSILFIWVLESMNPYPAPQYEISLLNHILGYIIALIMMEGLFFMIYCGYKNSSSPAYRFFKEILGEFETGSTGFTKQVDTKAFFYEARQVGALSMENPNKVLLYYNDVFDIETSSILNTTGIGMYGWEADKCFLGKISLKNKSIVSSTDILQELKDFFKKRKYSFYIQDKYIYIKLNKDNFLSYTGGLSRLFLLIVCGFSKTLEERVLIMESIKYIDFIKNMKKISKIVLLYSK